MPPNHFESEVESFLEGSHGDRTHIKRADHHTVTPLCGTLLHNRYKTLPAQQKTPKSAHSRRAGRKLSRSRRKQPTQGEIYPADHHSPATQRTLPGTKLSRHCPMGRPPPKSHAIPSAPEPTTTQNVGISMIEFQSWKYSSGNCMRNCRASRKTAHKAGPVVIHRPRLVCISCISANASDYQARTERS